jgi:hypothetical protein
MKTKLWKKVRSFFANRRIGDFVCNFTAVVLGIILTFMGSDWIEERNTQHDVQSALQLVKAELETNRKTILGGKKRIEQEIWAAHFLLENKDRLSFIPKDSLSNYSNLPFQISYITFTTDALELMKSSVLFPQIKDKKLGLSIIQAYASIKSADMLYTTYQTFKKERNDCLDAKPEVKRIYACKYSADQLWSHLLAIEEGYDLLIQIPNMINPESFDYLIADIDATIKAIEEYE